MVDGRKRLQWDFDINLGFDHAASAEFSRIRNTYHPVEKTFRHATKDESYRDIIRRATEVDRNIEKELGKSYDPGKSFFDKLSYRTHRFFSGLFDSYSDEVFSMLMEKAPYRKGAAMNTVCENAVECFEDSPEVYIDIIEEEYTDCRNVSHIALGIKNEADTRSLEVLQEPETKKLIDRYRDQTTPSVLDVRLISLEPERSFENIGKIIDLNNEIIDRNYRPDPMLESVPRMTNKVFELEFDSIHKFIENTSSMQKFTGSLDRFLSEEDGKRAEDAVENAARLTKEDLDPYEKRSIEMASVALPYHMDKVTEMMHNKYKDSTRYSKKNKLSEMDWRETVEKIVNESDHPRAF